MKIMKKVKLLGTLFLLPWLLVVAFGARYVSAAPAEQAGQTFTVMVGNGISTQAGDKPSWQGQNFYPGTVTINVGDNIQWKFNSGNEPHTVSFNSPITDPSQLFVPDPAYSPPAGAPPKILFNPVVVNPAGGTSYDGTEYTSSGVRAADLPAPLEYTLSFPKAGTYEYVCMLHSATLPDGSHVGMVGKIVVQDAGSAYPMTPAQVMAEGERLIASDAQMAKDMEPAMDAAAKPAEKLADGTSMYHVAVGNMDMARNLEYERFAPRNITIKAGDTVEWSLGMAPAFHTVTLGDEPELLMIEPEPAGPPKVVVNPQVLFPAGDNVYAGTGYYNSGPLAGPQDPPEAGIKSYTLKFTQPGRYEYICVPHYTLGMVGTIIVEAADSTGSTSGGETPPTSVGMPQTGAGDSGWIIYGMIALALALSAAGVALVLRLRKSA